MSHSSLAVVASVACLAFGAYTWTNYRRKSRLCPLPPGPKKLPILGNLLDLPKSEEWVTYQRWSRELGSDIVHLEVMGQSILILNSLTATMDLLDKRSSYYSGRPRLVMAGELMGWNDATSILGYGNEWKMHRRFIHGAFNATESAKLRPHEVAATHNLLRRLLRNPDNIMMHLRHWAGNIILRVTYGITALEENDPYIATAEKAIRAVFAAVTPGAFLVDLLPFLKYVPSWMPGAGFKTKAKEWRKLKEDMYNQPFNETQSRVQAGDATPSFTSLSLQRIDPGHDLVQRDAIKNAGGTMYGGGTDTTVSVISFCILRMLENPEILASAQAQIDRVVGNERLPTFNDQDKLPYITALVKESLRWMPVTPIDTPHVLERDDIYRGYRVPANTIVLANIWAILHDEETYPDPFVFRPERFLGDDGQLDLSVLDPADVAFGFGRRICPGQHMALSSIWIAIASLVAVFDISKATDKDGKPIPLSHEYIRGLVVIPAAFECSITPRSKDVEALILDSDTEGF